MAETLTVTEKHPRGLYLLFFAEMWERFSFYGNRALLVLFMTKPLMQGGLSIDKALATQYYGFIQGACYLTPIIGGIIADKLLGQRRSILIGGILMAIAQFILFLAAQNNTTIDYFWSGIILLVIGNGFFKPNISTLVGRLYPDGSPLKDQAYTIFYMGINIGAMSPLLIGPIVEIYGADIASNGDIIHYGFKYGFLLACIGMLIGQLIFNLLASAWLGKIGTLDDVTNQAAKLKSEVDTSGSVFSEEDIEKVLKKPFFRFLIGNRYSLFGNWNIWLVKKFLSWLFNLGLSKVDFDRMVVLVIITVFSIIFWLGFEQAGGSFTLYTDNYLDRHAFGYKIPTIVFQVINPVFILVLGYPLSLFWIKLGSKNPSLIVKMALGLALMGGGFFFMVGAAVERGGDMAAESALASMWWMVATYFVHTVAELMLSPVGLSAVSKLAPKTLTSVFMGVWFLSPFIAHTLAGFTESYIEELGAMKVFNIIGFGGLAVGVVMLLFSGKLVKMMHGAEKSLN